VTDLAALFGPDVVSAIEASIDRRVNDALSELGNASSPWFTVTEAAEYLRVSDRTIERLVARGKLPSYAIGRRRLFHRDALDAVATAGEDVAPTTSPRRRRGIR
jgi:excisionase family DNA binding protein